MSPAPAGFMEVRKVKVPADVYAIRGIYFKIFDFPHMCL
jgi:hypothetical protein